MSSAVEPTTRALGHPSRVMARVAVLLAAPPPPAKRSQAARRRPATSPRWGRCCLPMCPHAQCTGSALCVARPGPSP